MHGWIEGPGVVVVATVMANGFLDMALPTMRTAQAG